MQDKQTAVINTAVIVIGSYHPPPPPPPPAPGGAPPPPPLQPPGHRPGRGRELPGQHFFGIFAGDDAAELLTAILPFNFQANDFTGSVLAAAFSVFIIQRGYSWLADRLPPAPKKE